MTGTARKAAFRGVSRPGKAAGPFPHIVISLSIAQMTGTRHLPPDFPFGGENGRSFDRFRSAIIIIMKMVGAKRA